MYDRWRGWSTAETSALRVADDDRNWVELSHPLRTDLARVPLFEKPEFRRVKSMPRDPFNATEIHMICHFGTHVDAPCHFIPDGPAFHEIPLERLYGPGVVWHIRCEPFGLIEPDMFEQAGPPVRPGDILLLDTGWAEHCGDERYAEHPSLSLAAAEWLVEHQVKLLGIDFLTPDLAVSRRKPDFRWPVHHILLSHGVLIAENLTNLRSLAGRIEAMFLGLNIEGADGAPARVVARQARR
jgi:kynurenine formamidase